MPLHSADAAAITQHADQSVHLSGRWTALHLGELEGQIQQLQAPPPGSNAAQTTPLTTPPTFDASKLQALDTVGAWVLQKLMHQGGRHQPVTLLGMRPDLARLFEALTHPDAALGLAADVGGKLKDTAKHPAKDAAKDAAKDVAKDKAKAKIHTTPSNVEKFGLMLVGVWEQALAMLAFVGETSLTVWRCFTHPGSIRWRAEIGRAHV